MTDTNVRYHVYSIFKRVLTSKEVARLYGFHEKEARNG